MTIAAKRSASNDTFLNTSVTDGRTLLSSPVEWYTYRSAAANAPSGVAYCSGLNDVMIAP